MKVAVPDVALASLPGAEESVASWVPRDDGSATTARRRPSLFVPVNVITNVMHVIASFAIVAASAQPQVTSIRTEFISAEHPARDLQSLLKVLHSLERLSHQQSLVYPRDVNHTAHRIPVDSLPRWIGFKCRWTFGSGACATLFLPRGEPLRRPQGSRRAGAA